MSMTEASSRLQAVWMPTRPLPSKTETLIRLVIGAWLLMLLTGCQAEVWLKSIPLLGDIYRLPDIDQRFVDIPVLNLLINHRSILTHSALVPLGVAWLCRPLNKLGVFICLIPGTLFAFHFLLDLFPKKWYGHAWIHIPLLGWLDWIPFDNNLIPTVFSIGWLTLSLVLSQFSFLLVIKKGAWPRIL